MVIYNGIEDEFTSDIFKSKAAFGFNDNDIIITLVGRISRLKGHKLLLKTYINHLQENKKVKLLFVGSPVDGQEYYLHEVETIIKDNMLNNFVKIIQYTKNLNQIWNIADIAVIPSTEAESFGLVAAEAMLAQKPVIAANHGGLQEIVVNKKTGFLVEPKNEIALAEALKKLIDNPELRTAFGIAGHETALNKFTVEKYVNSFEAVFMQI